MAKDTAQFSNSQDVLLSVGPFMGLDTSTSPYFVAPTNCVSQQNVAVNRAYGAYCTAEGQQYDYIGSILPGDTTYAIGIVNEIITPGVVTYAPGVYVFNGNSASNSASVLYAGKGQPAVYVTNWSANTFTADSIVNPYDTKFVFAGTYVFVDCAYQTPQMVVPTAGFRLGTTAINWGITGPITTPSGSATGTGTLNGTYYYAVTFVNTSLSTLTPIESSSSPFTAAIPTTGAQQIALTGIPVSSDLQVTSRNIYRFGGTIGGTALLVGTISDNTTTTYTDNLADSAVTGQQLIIRQDPANQYGWQSICYHKGRMWGFGAKLGASTTNSGKSDLWYSNYLQLTSFNSVTQVLDCGSDANDSGIAIASLDSILVALKQQSLWVCYGNSQNDFITLRASSVGCVSKGSVAVGYGRLFWLSSDGVYYFDGSNPPVNISDGTITQGSIRTAIDTLLSTANTGSGIDIGTCGFIVNRTYYLSVYSVKGTIPSITYGYDLESGAWTVLPYGSWGIGFNRNVNNLGIVSTIVQNTLGSPLVLAVDEGYPRVIDQWFVGESNSGNPIASNWTTGITDSGATALTKEYRYIELIAPTQSALVDVTLYVNPGTNVTTFGPYQIDLSVGTNRHRVSIPPACTGYECQLKINALTLSKTIIDKVAVLGYIKRPLSPGTQDA